MSTDTSTPEFRIDPTGQAPPVRSVRRGGGLRARMLASSWQWPRRELVAFLAVALLVLIAVSAGTVLLSERIARANALEEAQRSVDRLANLLIAPLMPRVLAGDQEQRAELDRVIANRMRDGSIARVVIWSADGEVIWADDRETIGRRFPLTEELRAALDGVSVATLENDPEVDTAQAPASVPLVEVYVPLLLTGQDDLAFEAYLSYDGVDRQAARLRGEIIPMAVGALVILQLVQIPIAASLTRRVGRQERERAGLIERNFTASERERRAIAADVHDGPVQDLAGVSYALGALRPGMAATQQVTVDRLIGAVRNAVDSLRRLMIDIYPPDLSGPGLGVAIDDIVRPLRDHGLTVHVDVGALPHMSPEAAAVVYRTAKETLANVAHHAGAHTVWVRLEDFHHQEQPAVRLSVSDDGVGLPTTGIDRRAEGHLGLRLVVDRVTDLGGTVSVDERSGGGAAVTAVVPLEHPA